MFANAYAIASQFTHPVIVSARFRDGAVECGNGALVVLNEEGWFVTVAHLLETAQAHARHAEEMRALDARLDEIAHNPRLDRAQRQAAMTQLPPNPRWITAYSYWWGWDGVQVSEVYSLPEADLAIGRLEPFDPALVAAYPVLKNPRRLPPGTSLCKLGFPFHNITGSFDEQTDRFVLPEGTLPVPRFPIEGIYTREVAAGRSADGRYECKFIETSTPGLRGQSGGPVFDVQGRVWAIQAKTCHYPLGFSPTVIRNGQHVEENQFLNVGWGVHPETLVAFLTDNHVRFRLSAD